MFQYMLLLLEVALLIVTAYIFWQTRRTAAEITDNSVSSSADTHNSAAQQVQAARMMHEVTNLVAELQSLSSDTYQDFIRQKEELDQIVGQANIAIAELRNLVAQAETIPARYIPALPPVADAPPVESSVKPGDNVADNQITWEHVLSAFYDYLADNDRTDNTIARANTHLRQFLKWRNGTNFKNLPFNHIALSELDDYAAYLTTQAYQDGTIRRKITALRTFIRWLGTWSQNPFEPAIQPEAEARQSDLPAEEPAHAVPNARSLSVGNRFQAVYTLAEQGLDLSDIAARTGLEQEAVRMLLRVRANSPQ